MPYSLMNFSQINENICLLEKNIDESMFDESKFMPATVPGDIHLDLLKLGLIDDPYIGDNILKSRWVEESVWHYRTVFCGEDISEGKKAILNFDGIYLNSIIYLNGKEIGRHNNSFCPLRIDVTGKVLEGENVLIVMVESGLFYNCEKPIRHLYTATASVDCLLHKRLWLRAPQSHAEWDWSPRLLNVGIFGDVYITYDDTAVINDCILNSTTSRDLQKTDCRIRFFADEVSNDIATEYRIVVKLEDKSYEGKAQASNGCIYFEFPVENPRLWYPVGYGEQFLYDIDAELWHGEKLVYTKHFKAGFRHIEIDKSKHPKKGNYFIPLVNGVKVFCKGSNYVPADMITAAITRERIEKLLDLALESNINTMRVWGGGLYESDDFYSLCDEKGILVWQDCISACGVLPYSDIEFAENVHKELTYNVRRLSRYASLAFWCGGNELQSIKESFEDYPLYFDFIPKTILSEDPEKYYQPTSPYSEFEPCGVSDLSGDQHPWAIGFSNKDHRLYRDMECRFPNEGGTLGPNSMGAVKKSLAKRQESIHSFSWMLHDNMLESWQKGTSADENVKFWAKKDPQEMSVEDYVYLGGLVHAEGLREYIDNFRSRAFDTAAAIFWMYNDCWPCTRSWTIVDYELNRTPAFYPVKNAFSDIRVVFLKQDDKYTVTGVNGSVKDFCGQLRYGVVSCDGKYIYDKTVKITIPQNSSTPIIELDPEIIAQADKCSNIPFAVITDCNGKTVSTNKLINNTYEKYSFKKPDIKILRKDGKTTFESNVFVFGVCIDLEGKGGISDNMFDILPKIPVEITHDTNKNIDVLYTLNEMICPN